MNGEQLRIVDSLRQWSDLDDASWTQVRKQVESRGLEGASASARAQIATAMLAARVSKGDYVGHPFRGNQHTTASGASRGSAGSAAGPSGTSGADRGPKRLDVDNAVLSRLQGSHSRTLDTLGKHHQELAKNEDSFARIAADAMARYNEAESGGDAEGAKEDYNIFWANSALAALAKEVARAVERARDSVAKIQRDLTKGSLREVRDAVLPRLRETQAILKRGDRKLEIRESGSARWVLPIGEMRVTMQAARGVVDDLVKEVEAAGNEGVAKGDYVGHPFRGNQWTDASGASRGGAGSAVRTSGKAKSRLANRPKAIKVSSVKEAMKLMEQGKVVVLDDHRKVNTLLQKLHKAAQDAKDRGEEYRINLCNVSVEGTNLFCGDSLTDEDGQPLPRSVMPQLSGKAIEGSMAAKIADDKGEADAGPAFLEFLRDEKIKVTEEKVPAASLKASQAELVGPKVAAIMDKEAWDKGTVYVSSDNYVIDGHHRWAAAVGADAEDDLGDLKIKVVRIDMPISEVLGVATDFTDEFGIKPKSA